MSNYPAPSYAAYIWTVGDELHLGLPPQGHNKGHTVILPMTEKGLVTAIDILRDRERARALTVSTPGAPTQYEVWAAMKATNKKKREEREAAKAAVAREREAKALIQQLGGRKAAKNLLKQLGLL